VHQRDANRHAAQPGNERVARLVALERRGESEEDVLQYVLRVADASGEPVSRIEYELSVLPEHAGEHRLV
jgi:hypothetical protein